MSNYSWQRLGAASGIVYVVVILLPDFIQGGPAEEETMTTAQAIANACATSTAARFIDAIYPITHILAYLCFLFSLEAYGAPCDMPRAITDGFRRLPSAEVLHLSRFD